MKQYIKVYEDVFDADFCKTAIDIFEHYKDDHHFARTSEFKWDLDYRRFHELTASAIPECTQFFEQYYARIAKVYDHYRSTISNPFINNDYTFERARIKKYEANDNDQFGWHVDVGDSASSKRFLACFAYLNDVQEGGETVFQFDELDCTIKPKQGTMVIFPPMWMYPHKGMKPASGSKYIISTYLHYK